ncbi:protein FAR1-RELATED SEQUENCE 5-like [Silene latifolia]|uniref:protein FAR1-RELATED SEQUENCE 5-like n=1 Tax=Silene latifolia TaxID=37657 RepID=UPI003D77B1F4
MTEAHVPSSVQFRVAAAGAGGDAFVGHTKRDHINYVNRLKMKSIEGGDAATLINLMTSTQAEESGFFFRVQFDEKGRLSNLFWRDAMMRDDYLLYGDVKIFDTTYRINRYNLICGAFVGINNHWSNVMFGYAFLWNEREESFEWLFNVFNESMGEDVRPVSIFTDQYQAIANAIETVYPQTRHRLCQWHIQQNAISHFGKLKGDRPFQNLFDKCLHGCYNEAEFEENWHKILTEYGLVNHSWFKRLYKHRAKWSTTFNNQFFSAGILSSQRSESTNHAMGFQASKTTSVTKFFRIFENTVKRWRGEEERKEFNGIRSTPSSVYPLVDLLLHASQVYTLELFRVFEKEFALAMGTCAVIFPIDDPEVVLYRVSPATHDEDDHHVTYDCKNNLTELWERLLPSDIRRSAAHDAINWRRSMLTAMNYLITKCENVTDARAVVDKLFIKANEEVELLLSKLNMEEDQPTLDVSLSPILDPVRCTTKGRSQRKKRNMGTRKKARKGSDVGAGESTMYFVVPRLI